MTRFDAERNLLSGTLALQVGLIDQNALASSLGVWSDNKEKNLTQILVDQGALDDESKALVEALASKHLGIHGGNLEKSLGAMTVGRATGEILTRVGDSLLTATLAQAGSDRALAGSDSSAHSPGTAIARGQRFRVVRPHAMGGLGIVFVALDTELNREVALKQIVARHADDQTSRSRFLLEAEITGGLEESTDLRERLVAAAPADDPRRESYLSNLGSCYGNLGTAHLDEGALDQAIAWTGKALAIQDEQIKKHPNSVDYLERVGASHMVLGQLEMRTGHLTTARRELEQARLYLERLKHVRPGDVIFQMHLADCLGLLADV